MPKLDAPVTLLSSENNLEVVGQASNGEEAIALRKKLQPNIILMYVRMPLCDGVVATQEIILRYPWIKILVLTTFDDEYIWHSLRAEALGYLLKHTAIEQIVIAIRSLYLGYSQLGLTIAPKVFTQLQSGISSLEVDYKNLLSKREIDVLKLLGQGKNNREIAKELHLTEGTVRNYVSCIFTRISHEAGEKRSQKLPKYLLHMNSSSFKHDPSENRLYTGTVQI
ncbi:response regulator transcription factor [Nostoc flagelliforme FACHB-838]|uniref:Response regulator transcription factor n=1 Tax=Nostoc flagelliforme FACHB-838 TaxID=2692904 RepID=A0ABR8E100_9NOSO|nr:response regulator transcription factor [Nostoc flagelliforme]MBD2534792.1 response regulator transcription factor [Nostoc flagelliforme FACHB-838]